MSMFTSVCQEESFKRSLCDICEPLQKPFRNPYKLNIQTWLRASSSVHDSRVRDWQSINSTFKKLCFGTM